MPEARKSPIGEKGDLRIFWQSSLTGHKGHGDWFKPTKENEDFLIASLREANKSGWASHWIEIKK